MSILVNVVYFLITILILDMYEYYEEFKEKKQMEKHVKVLFEDISNKTVIEKEIDCNLMKDMIETYDLYIELFKITIEEILETNYRHIKAKINEFKEQIKYFEKCLLNLSKRLETPIKLTQLNEFENWIIEKKIKKC